VHHRGPVHPLHGRLLRTLPMRVGAIRVPDGQLRTPGLHQLGIRCACRCARRLVSRRSVRCRAARHSWHRLIVRHRGTRLGLHGTRCIEPVVSTRHARVAAGFRALVASSLWCTRRVQVAVGLRSAGGFVASSLWYALGVKAPVTCVCILATVAPAWAQSSKPSAGMLALGGQLTAWRVGEHGTELGAMAAVRTLTAGFAGRRLSHYSTQSLALGGGEGGFQAEYDNRFSYGWRVVRTGWGSVVARLGADIEFVATAHGSTGALGPLVDVGYQSVSDSAHFDLGWRGVVTVLPAVFARSGERHTWQWFSTGPRVGTRLGPVFLDAYVARTMEGRDMRTEFYADLCAVTSIALCTRVHEYRYDALPEHATLVTFFVGLGTTGSAK